MRLVIALFCLTALSLPAAAQCDPEAIFSTTDTNAVCMESDSRVRRIYSNSLPDHETGAFPNPGNPNTISAQRVTLTMCAQPRIADEVTWLDQGAGNCPFWVFGVATNGLEFDPIANEFFRNPNTNQLNRDWNLYAGSEFVNLGLDMNDAHVQPTGKYHYHGLPTKWIEKLEIDPNEHSPIIGYAADGFPIYYRYVHQNPNSMASPIVDLQSCYTLKDGNRPGDGIAAPDGAYDGRYHQDYEHGANGACDLDECNGRVGKTPEFPNGIYHYVITENYPVIPTCLRGVPDNSFTIGPPPAGCGVSNADEICTVASVLDDPSTVAASIALAPNPAQGAVTITYGNVDLQHHVRGISVLSSDGRRVSTVDSHTETIDVSSLVRGVYYIRFDLGETSVMKSLVVE